MAWLQAAEVQKMKDFWRTLGQESTDRAKAEEEQN